MPWPSEASPAAPTANHRRGDRPGPGFDSSELGGKEPKRDNVVVCHRFSGRRRLDGASASSACVSFAEGGRGRAPWP